MRNLGSDVMFLETVSEWTLNLSSDCRVALS